MIEGNGPFPAHDVIIATRNRPVELRRCLESVAMQTELPGRVIVIDASDDDAARLMLRGQERGRLGGRIMYRHSSPSTTRQRNEGVDASGADVVHFIDDDVVLEPEYLAGIMGEFVRDVAGEVGGVGGLITNLPAHSPTLVKRIMLLDSRRDGALLSSGRNVLVYRASRPIDVDWLSGCSMSFRRDVIATERFDDTGSGYVLGEDVDVGQRIRRRCRLVVTPLARLQHLESPRARLDRAAWTRREVVARYCRSRAGADRRAFLAAAFWWSVVGQALGYLLSALAHRSPEEWRRFRATVAGAGECLTVSRRAPGTTPSA